LREASKRLEEAALLSAFGRIDELRLRQRLVELDRLLDHHDDREARDVYGTLGEVLDEGGRGELLTGLAATSSAEPLVEVVVEGVLTHPTVQALAARYRAWLVGEPLPTEVPMPTLPATLAATLAKLLARDERAVAAMRDAEGIRERARREMLAEVALRSSLVMVVEALIRAS
ncbi:MAG: hypothetical protein KC731_00920, partial [Myxococcales bacterium]|nr:hypothetical protein [Myxococcales bacterium]